MKQTQHSRQVKEYTKDAEVSKRRLHRFKDVKGRWQMIKSLKLSVPPVGWKASCIYICVRVLQPHYLDTPAVPSRSVPFVPPHLTPFSTFFARFLLGLFLLFKFFNYHKISTNRKVKQTVYSNLSYPFYLLLLVNLPFLHLCEPLFEDNDLVHLTCYSESQLPGP